MKLQIKGQYSDDWAAIAKAVKDAARWRCIRCNHDHDPGRGFCLTVHHFDGDKSNNRWWNLMALCQRCHLSVHSRVNPEHPWIFEHSEWIKPYVAGFYAWKYFHLDLTRAQVAANMDEFLSAERMA